MSKHWYNDGINSGVFEEGNQPVGWLQGRISGCGKSTLGKHWYNNGEIQGNFFEGEQPKGWVKGSLGTTKGYRTYNNGLENKVFSDTESVPNGWVKGRLKSSNTLYKKSANKRKVYYYNNGTSEIKFIGPHTVPEGFTEGRLNLPSNRILRDKELADKGYIPLKVLVKKYGKSWYVNLPNIDKITYKDPYVYVNESEIPRIIDYINTNHSRGTSLLEKELLDFVKSVYDGNIISNTKAILKDDDSKYYELDIYIPDKNVAIEFNGIYWHSTNAGTDKNYHVTKTNLSNNLNIRLIHIFQDYWISKNDICKSIIKSALGVSDTKIYARNCKFKEVSKCDEKSFLQNNHIQGYVPSKMCFGLYFEDELVQLVSFRQSRFKEGELELVRQCSKLGYNVIGGFSKLMINSNINNCISYVDRSLFSGESYFKVGFKLIASTPPSYYYFNKNDISTRLNRINFQKHKLVDLLDNFDYNKTEVENMLNNNYLQVYDCGTYKVAWTRGA